MTPRKPLAVGDRFRAAHGGAIWRIVRMLDESGRRFPHAYMSREGEESAFMLLSTRALTESDQINWARVASR